MATHKPVNLIKGEPVIRDKTDKEKIGKGPRIIIGALAAIFLIFLLWLLWPKQETSKQQSTAPTILSVHAGHACRDAESGRQITLDHASTSETDFDAYIFSGCDTLVTFPTVYGYPWYISVTDDPDAHRYVYLKEQGASEYRRYDISSESNANMNWQSLRMYFQSAEKGGIKVHFHTDKQPVTLQKVANSSTAKDGLVTDPVPNVLATKAVCTEEAKRANFSGSAYVSFVVGEDGNPRDVKIAKSTGIPTLDANVIETAKHYKFRPAMQNGHPVPFSYPEVEVQIDSCHE